MDSIVARRRRTTHIALYRLFIIIVYCPSSILRRCAFVINLVVILGTYNNTRLM